MQNTVVEIQVKSFESYIAEGVMALQNKDKAQWKLGDLACLIESDYGNDTIGEFADAIGIDKKTIMNYRTTARTFTQEVRSKYNLTFSHFACLTGVTKPEAWLEQAQLGKWSVDFLRLELQRVYKDTKPATLTDSPPPVFECKECHKWRLKDMSAFDVCRGHYTWKNGQAYYE